MREVLEFISLLRASEKERYETQKKFMTDTIKTLKNISETIKNSSEFIRNNMEKMKEMISTDIAALKKESSLESLQNANKTLEESIEMVQRGVQIMEYRQAMAGSRNVLDDIREKISKMSNIPRQPAPNPTSAPTKPTPKKIKAKKKAPVEEIHEDPVTEEPVPRNVKPSQIAKSIPGHTLEKATFKETTAASLEDKQAAVLEKIKKKEGKKKKSKKFHIDF